jgi:hypothetical protein
MITDVNTALSIDANDAEILEFLKSEDAECYKLWVESIELNSESNNIRATHLHLVK